MILEFTLKVKFCPLANWQHLDLQSIVVSIDNVEFWSNNLLMTFRIYESRVFLRKMSCLLLRPYETRNLLFSGMIFHSVQVEF